LYEDISIILNLRRLLCKQLKWKLLYYKIIRQKFIEIIPSSIPAQYLQNEADFIRERKLPFPKLITFTLHITTSAKNEGVDIRLGDFFKDARRSGLWFDAEPVHRSAVTKARAKVPWQVFEDIFSQSVALAYKCYPDLPKYKWHGMSVFAIDGSKYDLPASEELRKKFDPNSGLEYPGKGHYPQCLVSTVYDVFRRIPIARTVAPRDSSEREEALKMLPHIPPDGILLFDRGYPSYEFIKKLMDNYAGYFCFRCPAKNSFPALEEFVASDKEETIIYINPSYQFLKKASLSERKNAPIIKLRAIKLYSPDGELSILLTNLFNQELFSTEDIRSLYYKRWGVESYYRDEKITVEIEKFHSKSYNGIMQELFAAAIMSVISRTLMVLSVDPEDDSEPEPQFKHTVKTLGNEIFVFFPEDSEKVVEIFKELLIEIARVKYYKSKKDRKPQPRVCKKSPNKWALNKNRKLMIA
jgi:hypothetical protein